MANVLSSTASEDEVFQDKDCSENPENKVKNEACVARESGTESRCLRPRKGSEKLNEKEIVRKIRAVVDQKTHSCDDLVFLEQHKPLVKLVKQRRLSYSKTKERNKEVEDDPAILIQSSIRLAQALASSQRAVLYTGAGISTAANIPDYRGVDGVWTKLQNGETLEMDRSLVTAVPTFTHMAVQELVRAGVLKHVVSQNCDGLHVRSGIPPDRLSEIHGNMFAEFCVDCRKSFYRIFDVTERTGLRRHLTSRTCDACGGKLEDTIVHFGERSAKSWPHHWQEAENHARESDLIICLGSSLKVLRSYKQLWHADRPKSQRPKLIIVNMQWTPKDSQADLKINGRSDYVMQQVMKHLQMPVEPYKSMDDPLLRLATPVLPSQCHTFRTLCIPVPSHCLRFPEYRSSDDPTTGLPPSATSPADDVVECGKDDEAALGSPRSPQGDVVVPGWFGKGRRKAMPRKCVKRRRKKKV